MTTLEIQEDGKLLAEVARYALLRKITKGEILPAKEFSCAKCGNPAREYHHHKGYKEEFWFDVIPLCISCHRRIEQEQGAKCQGVTLIGEKCTRLAQKGTNFCFDHLKQANLATILSYKLNLIEREIKKLERLPDYPSIQHEVRVLKLIIQSLRQKSQLSNGKGQPVKV